MIKSSQKRSFQIFMLSILCSAVLHVGAIFYLKQHLLSFYRSFFTQNLTEKEKFFEKLTEDDILFLAFDQTQPKDFSGKTSVRNAQKEKKEEISLSKAKKELSLSERERKPLYEVKELLSTASLIEDHKKCVHSIYCTKYFDQSSNMLSPLKKKLMEKKMTFSEPLKKRTYFSKKEPQKDFLVIANKDLVLSKKTTLLSYPVDFQNQEKNFSQNLQATKQKYTLAEKEKRKSLFLPFLPHIPSLEDLNTISCGEDFSYSIEYISRSDDVGYIFALVLIPKPNNKFRRIKQNFYFLIDRSNSIQQKRLTMTRHAVASAVSALHKEDHFNIVTFDSKLTQLFPTDKTPTHQVILKTKDFLRNLTLGNFLASSSFFLPLHHMLKNPVKEDEINNIILISDGEGIEKFKNRNLIREWTLTNQGEQSFFCVSCKQDKNLSILDFLSTTNKGKLVTSTTLRGLKRHLLKLVKSLNYPVAKNVSVHLYEKDADTHAILWTPKKAHLYLDQPYVIIGSVKKLEDFTIFIQGRNPKTWFNIKKEISFQNASSGGKALEERWALFKANQCYDLYLQKGNVKYLKSASEILKPYNLPPAFK